MEKQERRQELRDRIGDILAMMAEEREERRGMHRDNVTQNQRLSDKVNAMNEVLRGEVGQALLLITGHSSAPGHGVTIVRLDKVEVRLDKLEDAGVARKARNGVLIGIGALVLALKDQIWNTVVVIFGGKGGPRDLSFVNERWIL